MTDILRIEGLHNQYGPVEVLKGIDLSVAPGEVVIILGASGSGKSTLLRCVNLLQRPSRRRLVVDGLPLGGTSAGARYPARQLRTLRSRVGMVFQQFNLFPHLTIEWNVIIVRCGQGFRRNRRAPARPPQPRQDGVLEKAREYPARLSGGQQQRVAIARALAMQPP